MKKTQIIDSIGTVQSIEISLVGDSQYVSLEKIRSGDSIVVSIEDLIEAIDKLKARNSNHMQDNPKVQRLLDIGGFTQESFNQLFPEITQEQQIALENWLIACYNASNSNRIPSWNFNMHEE